MAFTYPPPGAARGSQPGVLGIPAAPQHMTLAPPPLKTVGMVLGEGPDRCGASTRLVALLTIVLAALTIVGLIGVSVYLGVTFGFKGIVILHILLCALVIAFYAADIWVSCNLLAAVDPMTEADDAFDKANCWFNFNFVVMIIELIFGSVSLGTNANPSTYAILVMFLVRMAGLFFVYNYRWDLDHGSGMMVGGRLTHQPPPPTTASGGSGNRVGQAPQQPPTPVDHYTRMQQIRAQQAAAGQAQTAGFNAAENP